MDDRPPRGGRPGPRSAKSGDLGGGGDLARLLLLLSGLRGRFGCRVVAHGQQAGGDDGVGPDLGLDGAEDLLGDVGMLPQERSRVLPALSEALVAIAEVRAGLLDELPLERDVEDAPPPRRSPRRR